MTDATARSRRDATHRHLCVLSADLNQDELDVLIEVTDGLKRGRDAYGPLDLATDRRDFDAEAQDELRDFVVYRAIAALKKRRAERAAMLADLEKLRAAERQQPRPVAAGIFGYPLARDLGKPVCRVFDFCQREDGHDGPHIAVAAQSTVAAAPTYPILIPGGTADVGVPIDAWGKVIVRSPHARPAGGEPMPRLMCTDHGDKCALTCPFRVGVPAPCDQFVAKSNGYCECGWGAGYHAAAAFKPAAVVVEHVYDQVIADAVHVFVDPLGDTGVEDSAPLTVEPEKSRAIGVPANTEEV